MKLKLTDSLLAGFGFGTTSGVITTLGAIVGIFASSHNKPAILAAIVTVGVADAFSDALGEHISEESRADASSENVKHITLATFFSKMVVGLSFLFPFLVLDIYRAVIVSIIYGAVLLSLISCRIARISKEKPFKVIGTHLLVALCVIVVTFLLGNLIDKSFDRTSI